MEPQRDEPYRLTCALNKDYISLRIFTVFVVHMKTLHPWLSKMRSVKILISLRECAGWSEYSLGEHDGTLSDVSVQSVHFRAEIITTAMVNHQSIWKQIIFLRRKCIGVPLFSFLPCILRAKTIISGGMNFMDKLTWWSSYYWQSFIIKILIGEILLISNICLQL